MKIAHIVSTPPFAWGTGGSARVVYDQAKALAVKGHEVSVISTDMFTPGVSATPMVNPEKIDGFLLYRFPCISSKLAWKYKFYASFQMMSYMKNHISDFDVVHLHDLISVHAISTMRHCIKNDVPYVLTAHGSIPWLKERHLINLLYSMSFGRRLINNASKISALTATEREQLVNYGVDEKKIEIIPNGVSIANYVDLPPKGGFRKKFGIGSQEKVILYLGRIHEIKGLDLLVKSFHNTINEVTNVRLVIAGPDDGYLSTLLGLIKDLKLEQNVILTGPLYDADKIMAFVDSDIYVLSSHYEAFALSLIEAMACDMPIIVTKRCAISDVVKDGGIVVGHNEKEFSAAMVYLLHNDEKRKQFGVKGRSIVLEKYNLEKIILDVENFYASAIRGEVWTNL